MPGSYGGYSKLKFAANSESIAAFGYTHWRQTWEYVVRSTSDGEVIGSLKIHDERAVVGFGAAISPTQTLGVYAMSGFRSQIQFWNLKGEMISALDCFFASDKLRFSDDGARIETGVGNLLVPRLSLEDKDRLLSTRQEIPRECILANKAWITWGWDNIL